MVIPFYYEIPLFVFVALAIYTIYSLVVARRFLVGGKISSPYLWFIIATVFFALWGIDHVYHDLVLLPPDIALFFHYTISHGFLLISMFCVAVAAHQTRIIYGAAASGESIKK
jgi:hypothetical protein